jgi:hypothetical protein
MEKFKKEAYGIKFTVIENNLLPPKGYSAINLGVIFVRDINVITDNVMRHEAIHTLQARELLYIPYYIMYLLEYVVKLCLCFKHKKAYYSISFEQEAYNNARNLNYRKERRWFAFMKYIFKMK